MARFGFDAIHHLHRLQRGAAHIEEVIVSLDLIATVQAKNRCPDGSEAVFCFGARIIGRVRQWPGWRCVDDGGIGNGWPAVCGASSRPGIFCVGGLTVPGARVAGASVEAGAVSGAVAGARAAPAGPLAGGVCMRDNKRAMVMSG